MKKTITCAVLLALVSFNGYAENDANQDKKSNANNIPVTSAPADAKVFIISPKNGDSVSEKFIVKFGISGMVIAPAGTELINSGHHHLLIDQNQLPQEGMPMGTNVMHFGKGQTETELTLSKGTHTLQLVLGDKSHVPHNPVIASEVITINVE